MQASTNNNSHNKHGEQCFPKQNKLQTLQLQVFLNLTLPKKMRLLQVISPILGILHLKLLHLHKIEQLQEMMLLKPNLFESITKHHKTRANAFYFRVLQLF